MVADYYVRPMRPADVEAAQRVVGEAFDELDRRTARARDPEPPAPDPARAAAWRARTSHLLATDPAGSFVAEDDQRVLGVAVGLRRDTTWVLSTYAVRPALHGRGIGRTLLDAAASHGNGCLRSMLAATDDPAALRRYRLAGFDLHPTMTLTGHVRRELLPVVERVREGSPGDVDLMDSVDRQVRGSAHGPDHAQLLTRFRLVVADRPTGSGYAYVEPGRGLHLLAATTRRTATELLWESLASSAPDAPFEIGHVTGANQWALDVGVAARLSVGTDGYLALRGMRPPTPYLPSAHFL